MMTKIYFHELLYLTSNIAQVYEGLVSMNFAEDLMASDGHGDYRNLSPATLPQFFLAYQRDPSDSGRIHSDVRARYGTKSYGSTGQFDSY